MDGVSFQLRLELPAADDPHRTEQQTVNLANELGSIRGLAVDRVRTEAPPDTKAVDVETIGTLVGIATDAAEVIPALWGVLQSWLHRERGRTIHVCIGDRELDLSDATPEERRQLIELFARSNEDD